MNTAVPPHLTREVCYRCFKAATVCVCPTLAEVDNRTHVHVIQHPRERHKAIGTVRFAELGLARCTVEICPPRGDGVSDLASAPRAGVALLSPGPGAIPIESLPVDERPSTLVVLDGTWTQAAALRHANPWLAEVRQLTFENPPPSRYRIRSEPKENYLSTIESIVAALRVIEPETVGLDGLLAAFDAMVEVQLEHVRLRRSPRFARRSRPPLSLLRKLRDERGRVVLVHAETAGPRHALKPLQVCAYVVATGEQRQWIVEPDEGWPLRKMTHLGWHSDMRAEAISEAAFGEEWRAFGGTERLIVAWNQRTLDTLPSSCETMVLKRAFAEFERPCGDVGVVLKRHGLTAEPTSFDGRSKTLMGELIRLAEHLAEVADAPKKKE